MYYPDLSVYEYIRHEGDNVLNIGWLDELHEFPKGKVSEQFLEKLQYICFSQRINQTRGYHRSPFLTWKKIFRSIHIGYPIRIKSKLIFLGSAEIRVPGKNNIIYAAPNLIYHYVKDCHYLPPSEFIKAVNEFSGP
jgi:hypothetical protein